jgi:hypothetical protein
MIIMSLLENVSLFRQHERSHISSHSISVALNYKRNLPNRFKIMPKLDQEDSKKVRNATYELHSSECEEGKREPGCRRRFRRRVCRHVCWSESSPQGVESICEGE